MFALRIQLAHVFATEQDAIGPLVALAEVLATATRCGLLWARRGNALLPFDAGTIGRLLAEERSLYADDPQRATHLLSLCATPEAPGEVGVGLVNVRPAAGAGAAPGLVASVSLAEAAFDTDAECLRRLLEACVDAVSPDLALIGPSAWLDELGVGWATFTHRIRRELLPAGAVVIATKSGSIVIAHIEAPASESASAREAVLQVRDALSADPPKNAAPVPDAPPPRDTPSTVSPVQPSYLVAPPPLRALQPSALAGTALGSAAPPGPALPFSAAPPEPARRM